MYYKFSTSGEEKQRPVKSLVPTFELFQISLSVFTDNVFAGVDVQVTIHAPTHLYAHNCITVFLYPAECGSWRRSYFGLSAASACGDNEVVSG